MTNSSKTTQLQIRVSVSEKAAIQQAAHRMNMDMSSYVLNKVLPIQSIKFQNLVNELSVSDESRFVLSEINLLLSRLDKGELKSVFSITFPGGLSDYLSNYLAAMVEFVCNKHQVTVPEWTKSIKPLKEPVFGSKLKNLRLYLLTHSPVPFRQRNIFIDTTVGGQI